MRSRGGFSLIEILIIIGILGVLLTVVLVAINPAAPPKQSNNVVRQAAVTSIVTAVKAYMQKHDGKLPPGVNAEVKTIASDNSAYSIDLCDALVPDLLADIPLDPVSGQESPPSSVCNQQGAVYNSGYTISGDATAKTVTVSAPAAENDSVITLTR